MRPLDPRIDAIRSLRDAVKRSRSGSFLAEGVRFLSLAEAKGVDVETVIIAPDIVTLPLAHEIAQRLRARGATLYTVTAEVFHAITLQDEPQGVAAVMRQEWHSLDDILPGDGLCWLALEGTKNPGNLGTALRSAEAVGTAGLILIGPATDPYHPACVRASMGSLFSQKLVRATASQVAKWAHAHGVTIVGTSPEAAQDYREADFGRPTLLLMGSERKGLMPDTQRLCDVTVRIPMTGATDSLNLGVATSILLYEVFRRRT